MYNTENSVIKAVTMDYLENKLDLTKPIIPEQIEYEILNQECKQYEMHNATYSTAKWPYRRFLTPEQIATIINHIWCVANIDTKSSSDDVDDGDKENCVLGFYENDGVNKGLYSANNTKIKYLAHLFNHSITTHEINEVIDNLINIAPKKNLCTKENLIAVNNGIFNYDTKELLPFSPEYVFMSKSRVDYNPNATNVVIHNDDDGTDWDVETWIKELTDDPELTKAIWEILGAIIRPNVHWNKSAFLYSESGNNGKGTLCVLMQQLCGKGSYVALQLSDMSKEFALEPLLSATAIINDENDVGQYIDRSAKMKAIITGDEITINRKHKKVLSYKFRGFMVQCLNEYPRFKDKTGSLYRRCLFVPFNKCFTGDERTYIKDDYVHRKEVLEYVMKKLLLSHYYKLSEPQASKMVLDSFKEYNDPVRQFASEIIPQCVWDLLPFSFLYELYKEWMERNMPQGNKVGNPGFIQDLLSFLDEELPGWYCRGKDVQVRTGHKMDKAEPLIWRYQLKEWMNPGYRSSSDLNKLCRPQLAQSYRGLLRMPADGKIPDKD